mmetsp:Transcript_49152/g.106984  ORF Transcript_49152/g.106984 Transcript_49152/m.106984 type:complete len:94 (-) Transcript_49152:1638-1919(-)
MESPRSGRLVPSEPAAFIRDLVASSIIVFRDSSKASGRKSQCLQTCVKDAGKTKACSDAVEKLAMCPDMLTACPNRAPAETLLGESLDCCTHF